MGILSSDEDASVSSDSSGEVAARWSVSGWLAQGGSGGAGDGGGGGGGGGGRDRSATGRSVGSGPCVSMGTAGSPSLRPASKGSGDVDSTLTGASLSAGAPSDGQLNLARKRRRTKKVAKKRPKEKPEGSAEVGADAEVATLALVGNSEALVEAPAPAEDQAQAMSKITAKPKSKGKPKPQTKTKPKPKPQPKAKEKQWSSTTPTTEGEEGQMPAIHTSPEAAEAAVAAAEPHYKQTNVASIVEAKVKNPAQPDPQPTLKNRGHPITVKKSVAARKKTGTKLQNKKKKAGKETNSESSAIPRCSPGGAIAKMMRLDVAPTLVSAVIYAAELVAAEVRSGGWVQQWAAGLGRRKVGIGFGFESEARENALRLASEAIVTFADDRILPSLASAALSSGREIKRPRSIVSTFLALREILMQNSDAFFFSVGQTDYDRSDPDGDILGTDRTNGLKEEETALQAKLLATGLVVGAAVKYDERNAAKDSILGSLLDAIKMYDAGDDEFAECLEKVDGRTICVLPDGKELQKEERTAWRIAFNTGRKAHPLIKTKMRRDVARKLSSYAKAGSNEANNKRLAEQIMDGMNHRVEIPSTNTCAIVFGSKSSAKEKI